MSPALLALLPVLLVAEASAISGTEASVTSSGFVVQAPLTGAPMIAPVAADAIQAARIPVPAPGGPTLLVISRADGCGMTLVPGAEPGAELAVTIRPRASLAGRIATPQGGAVAGARVEVSLHHADRHARRLIRALHRDEGRSTRALLGPAEIPATDDGGFRIDDACAGEWSLRARAPAWLPGEPVVVAIPQPPALDGTPAPATRVVLPDGWSPSGRVVERVGETTLPVAGATVTGKPASEAQGKGGREATTRSKDDGSFALHGFPPGQAELVVTAEGFAEHRGVHGPDGSVIVLQRLGAIRFTVATGEDAAPPESVRASILSLREGLWAPDGAAVETAREGDAHLVRDVAPGRHGLVVQVPGCLPLTVDAFDVASGGVTDLGELAPQRSARITGLVLDAATETPVPGAIIRPDVRVPGAPEKKEPSPFLPETVSDAEGRFTLEGLPAGTWLLAASAEGWADGAQARTTVTIDHDVEKQPEPVTFRLERPGDLLVRVLDRQDRPLPGVNLWVRPEAGGETRTDVFTDPAGEAWVRDLAPGPFVVGRLDGRWHSGREAKATVRAGAQAIVVMKEDGARVTGRVVAGGSAVPCRVAFSGHRATQLALAPSYELRDVPPGSHQVSVAWAMVNEDGSFAEGRSTMRTLTLVVPDGVPELVHDFEVELAKAPPAETSEKPPVVVTGRLVDAETGEPLALGVFASMTQGMGRVEAPTDASGAFTLALPQGAWTIAVNPPESQEWWFDAGATVIVQGGQVVMRDPDPLVVTARRSRRATLRVVDASGAAVPGAECRPLQPPYVDEEGNILARYAAPATGDALGHVSVRLDSDDAIDLACVVPGRALVLVGGIAPGEPPRVVALPPSGSVRVPAPRASERALVEPFTGRSWRVPLAGSFLQSLSHASGDEVLIWGLPAGTWGLAHAGGVAGIAIEPGGVVPVPPLP